MNLNAHYLRLLTTAHLYGCQTAVEITISRNFHERSLRLINNDIKTHLVKKYLLKMAPSLYITEI